MRITVRREALSSVLGFALILGGCPKRQTSPRIVYVSAPAPPPQAAADSPASGTLVIAEPAPPPEPEVLPVQPAAAPEAPKKTPPRRRAAHPESASQQPADDDTDLQPIEQPTAEVPPLEPRETSQEESTLRRDVVGVQESVQVRIAQLSSTKLNGSQLKALEDARTFLAQSNRALQEGDLQRSLTLARKASLLVTALQPGQ